MFIDTHCHLNMMVDKKPDVPLHEEQIPAIVDIALHAARVGVDTILNVGTSVIESKNSIMIAQACNNVYASVGIHPCDAHDNWRDDFATIKSLAIEKEKNKIRAIGETGLDYYHLPFNKERQQDAFKAHIELALEHNLPVVIHIRGDGAPDDVLKIVEEYKNELRGVNHCFMHDEYVARAFIDMGFYLGIDAPITYPKNQPFRDLIAKLPLESLILETDAPFLPPQSMRGKKNSPVYIPEFAAVIADLHNTTLDEVGRITSQNARTLFKF